MQRRARRALRRVHRTQRPGPRWVEGLLAVIQRPGDSSSGGVGVPFEAERFRRRGILIASGRRDGTVEVHGVVPDGVATVTLRYPRRDREFTGKVRDNVVAIPVGRMGLRRNPLDATYIWRGPDGAIVNQY